MCYSYNEVLYENFNNVCSGQNQSEIIQFFQNFSSNKNKEYDINYDVNILSWLSAYFKGDDGKIEKFYNEGVEHLKLLQRQSVVNKFYTNTTHILEDKQ